MTTEKRKTRSDKFPLTRHSTGQYCKKIHGKMFYFGSDRKEALERYLDQAAYLHGRTENSQKATNDAMTLKQLCDMFSKYQFSKVRANAITARHYNDQVSSLNKLMAFLGQSRRIKNISTIDLQNYKRKLQKQYSSGHRLNLHISNLKTLFHWAKKNDILQRIPNIDAVSRSKIINIQRRIFTHEEINKLLAVADAQMRAMIWLGLNCGFGCTDCSELQWKHLDLINGRVVFPRGKTGVPRDLPLWPETIQALKTVPKKGKLVFYTARGNPFVRNVLKTDANGNEKYCPLNSIVTKFSRMIKKAGLNVPKGTGFYPLRRTAATLAARSGDPFAVQRLLGHANLLMATRYVQDVSKQTDEVVKKSRIYML
ncbi:MAG: tyrosine-type recombinase/integrase [Deltaproteobacteria bacterium]|nr:tyrosine-type recombinase/integrase [Deltaproteobacteria bacterium]